MKVELFEPGIRIPCGMGSIVNVTGMDYHGKAIPPGTCSVSITSIKKGLVKLPLPNSEGTKLKDVENGVVLWRISKLSIAKHIMMHI
jgi:hypothetical protein